LQQSKATESFPFNKDTLVFKVLGKIFALCPLSKWEAGAPSITLKCDPTYALQIREQYHCIKPGFHANKKHWNTIYLKTNEVSTEFLFELISHSYDMVLQNMSKKQRDQLKHAL
jgi:predicted DNA-binding protein (MmcQ/YjbR family)